MADHLLDLVQDAVVIHDLDHRILYWNRAAQHVFGYTREQALGQRMDALMGPTARLSPSAQAQLLEQGGWDGEVEYLARDGSTTVVHRRCALHQGSTGHGATVLSVHTDITERRRAEKEIVLLNNLLEQRIRRRTEELEESNDDLRDFAYSLAHDLRAPLSSIDGFSAQLEERLAHRLDARESHYLQRVRAGVRLMADLTDGLLALADTSHTPLEHQAVDLTAVARMITERLREQEPHRQVLLELRETPPAQGDPRLLADVLQNLLGNAWKFSAGRTDARIVFGAEPAYAGTFRYFVSDNGAGFDPEYAYKLFSPFQRLHSVREFKGTGIGLAIVRKIVSRHGGRVWAEGRPGAGATFFFTLHEPASLRAARPARPQGVMRGDFASQPAPLGPV
ncbi:MAG TPA: ATP-binding protein [Ramlibacter sp.]|nr:ATP-binding protein [Ramlibacter sp.]